MNEPAEKKNKRILQDGEVLHIPMRFLDAEQRAISTEAAREEHKRALADAWRDPASASSAVPEAPIPVGDAREDAYAARDHALTNAWRNAGR